jgi:hypothetical protein
MSGRRRGGDAVSVAAEVAVDLLGSAKGTLGIDDPTRVMQAPTSATSGASIIGVTEVPAGLECGKAGEEFAADVVPSAKNYRRPPGSAHA